jgi:subtilisin family serine protease
MLHAADIGAEVANMSLGGGFNKRILGRAGFPGFNALINRTVNEVRRGGTLLVVSAGNEARDLDHDQDFYKTYCSSPTALCVSATGPTAQVSVNGPWTNVDALASYSNFGRSAIDVAAPGGNVSAVWQLCSSFTMIWQVTGGFSVGRGDPALPAAGRFCPRTTVNSVSTVGTSGTSMASPHVAGLAALVAASGVTSPAQIKAALLQGADDLGEPGTDAAYGKGRINVVRTLGL